MTGTLHCRGLTIEVENCRNIAYFISLLNLRSLPADGIEWLALFAFSLTEAGTATRSTAECLKWQASVCSHFTASVSVVEVSQRAAAVNIQLFAKLLSRKAAGFFAMCSRYIREVDFSNVSRVQELLSRFQHGRMKALQRNGAGFVLAQASSGHSLSGFIRNRLSGLESFCALLAIPALDEVAVSRLSQLRDSLAEATEKNLLIAARAHADELCKGFEEYYELWRDELQRFNATDITNQAFEERRVREWWLIDSRVGSCALSFDARRDHLASLALIAEILSAEYIQPRLRDAGGAYVAGARLSPGDGALQLYSSRTRDLGQDLAHMMLSVKWFIEEFNDPATLESARQTVISRSSPIFSIPATPLRKFCETLGEARQRTEDLLGQLTLPQLKEIASTCLSNERCSIVVASGSLSLDLVARYDLQVRSISGTNK